MNQRVVLIAGAHRSGTSMLARLLHHCGLYLGPETEMMAAAEDNPDGFWENVRFVGINDEALNAAGAAWDLPPGPEESFSGPQFRAAQAKARLLFEDFASSPVWGWKDPRNCLTLPFWHELLPEAKTVIIVRNPLEVAYSMHKRNGLSYALGLRLWEIYNRRLIAQSNSADRIITDYERFFLEPEAELHRIAVFAGIPAEKISEAASIVAQDRRHTSFSKEQLIEAGVAEDIIALFDELKAEAAGESKIQVTGRSARAESLAGTPSTLHLNVPESENLRRELAEQRGTTIEFKARIEELNAERIRSALEIGRRDGRITELQSAYERLNEFFQKSETERQRLFAELDREQKASARVVTELEQLRERFTQTNRLLQDHSIQLQARETQAVDLVERLRKQLGETKRLSKMLDETANASEALRKSRRWAMANPFTWFLNLLSGKETRGFGYLDKVVTKYRAWQNTHPSNAEIDHEIANLRGGTAQPAPTYPRNSGSGTEQSLSRPKPPAPEKPIKFPQSTEVQVSIVIPVFNQLEYTLACLASLQREVKTAACEVIVVDDCSSDDTPNVVSQIPGVVYLRNEKNAGFVASCNRGAEEAKGDFLVFLNNDTVVKEGWLSHLLATFDLYPKAGLAGSKLVYPDGRLQEAGGVVWRDGSAWNWGKFKDPGDPRYNFLRPVDYCSGASIMIRRSLFRELGGFDLQYAPGYYEDVDLAFKVRQAGLEVFYQPLSEVIHYEGVTGGTDLSTGAKKYQEINRTTFCQRWREELSQRPVNGDVATYESLPEGRKRILVIDHHLPMSDRDAGSMRMFFILVILRELGHEVVFLPDNLADIPPYGDALRKRGIAVAYYPHCKSVADFLEKADDRFDLVILSRCDFARKHIGNVRRLAPSSFVIFDTVDLHHLRLGREAALKRDAAIQASAEEKEKQEYELIDAADQTWVVSDYEKSLLQQHRPTASIEVVPTIVEAPGSTTPFGLRQGILFIGSFQHTPNIDAVLFFTEEIFPLILKHLPGVKFYVIGDKAPPSVISLASEEVIVTGFQQDVRPYFETIRLSVAPLRFGAGVKGKINHSMGLGLPVVATTLATEGMSLQHRNDILIADSPTDFAAAVVELYQSESLWSSLSRNGLDSVRKYHSPEAVRTSLARILLKGIRRRAVAA